MGSPAGDRLDWDYRDAHLHRGADYDAALAGDPFDAFLDTRERALLLAVVRRWFPRGIPRYLDFACGTGRITELVAPFAVQSYGVDISESMLALARTKCPQTTFLLRDLTREAAAMDPVQLVTAFRFFGNAQDELRHETLRALHAVLTDDGVLILDNHRNPWTLRNGVRRLVGRRSDELVGTRLDLHYGKLRHLLTTAGFRIESVQGIGFWMVRARLAEPRILNSRTARVLERASRLPSVGPFSPAYVVVATKRPATLPARPR